MRRRFVFLLCLLGLVLTACDRWTLPGIQNKAVLQSDCKQLFQQYPIKTWMTNASQYDDYQQSLGIRKIPESSWPASVQALHPYLVCTYQGGIQIWVLNLPWRDQGKKWAGYYVVVSPEIPPPPQAATNHFIFEPTADEEIYFLRQSKFQN